MKKVKRIKMNNLICSPLFDLLQIDKEKNSYLQIITELFH